GVPHAWMRHQLLMVEGRNADEETRRRANTVAAGEERTHHDTPQGDHPRLSRRPPARGCHVPPLWGHPSTYYSSVSELPRRDSLPRALQGLWARVSRHL